MTAGSRIPICNSSVAEAFARNRLAVFGGAVRIGLFGWPRLPAVDRTKRSRARFNSLASVGNITAFGCTVVSTTTRAKSLGFIASVRVATDKLSWMSAVSFASPIRCRHRVSDERSNGLAAHVGVELRQSYAAGLLSLPRPHRSPSLDHLEGNHSLQFKKSQKQFARKPQCRRPIPAKAIAWKGSITLLVQPLGNTSRATV